MRRNPLVELPRSQPAQIIPPRGETNLLDWLESRGRMVARAGSEEPGYLVDAEDPEIAGLIDADSVDDDFDVLGDDEELGYQRKAGQLDEVR